MSAKKLIDKYNRHLTYLRISITDRCNLRCTYCVPHDRIPRLSHEEVLRYEEILRIVKIGVELGISKVRITGGEPLVRKGVYEFLDRLSQIPGISEVTLTTNGMNLKDNLEKIKTAGIKLNVVALRGTNDDELLDFAKLTFRLPYHVRFIEYMPIGKSRMQFGPPLLVPEIIDQIRSIGQLKSIEKNSDDGPAARFKFEGALGELGFISALSHHFCGTCNRLRLTASGQLRPCLLSDHQLDLKTPLRAGRPDSELAELFCRAVTNKPSDHNLAINNPAGVSCQMSSIGG